MERAFAWVFDLEAWREMAGMEGRREREHGRHRGSQIERRRVRHGAEHVRRRPGSWPDDPPWNGWWGENPPYHVPVFILTHHPREPLEMEGGTTFLFVTGGIEPALEEAKRAAGDRDVRIAGGADAVRQYLPAGLVDEFEVNLAPVILGGGERLFEDVGDLTLEQVRAIPAPGVTHLKYRVVR
jgi:dihydrofolate reductase